MSYYQLGGDIEGEAGTDYSGSTVALSADGATLAVGAAANDGGGPDAGHVRIYTWAGVGPNGWTQLGPDIDGEAPGDSFSKSISLSADGRTVAIGAHRNDGGGRGPATGHVQILRLGSGPGGGTWIKLGRNIDGETPGGSAGTSVSISADGVTVAVGASTAAGGEVRVSVWNDGASRWELFGQALEGESDGDNCGFSVALSDDGRTVAFGAIGVARSTGRVYSYIYVTAFSSWLPVGTINGEVPGEEFGYSLAMSGDGTIIGSGARLGAAGAGRVGVYQRSGFAWEQLGTSIVGEEANDYSGSSVDLSSNGRSVVVGAHGNNGAGLNAGHVRVFEYAAVPTRPPTTSVPTASDPPTSAPVTPEPSTSEPSPAPSTSEPSTSPPTTLAPTGPSPTTSGPTVPPSSPEPTPSPAAGGNASATGDEVDRVQDTGTGEGGDGEGGEGGEGGSKGTGSSIGSNGLGGDGGKGGSKGGSKGMGGKGGSTPASNSASNAPGSGKYGSPAKHAKLGMGGATGKQGKQGRRSRLMIPNSTAKSRSSASSWALLASAFLMTVGVAVGVMRRKMTAEDDCYVSTDDMEYGEASFATETTALLASPARFRSSPGRFMNSPGRLRYSPGRSRDPDLRK